MIAWSELTIWRSVWTKSLTLLCCLLATLSGIAKAERPAIDSSVPAPGTTVEVWPEGKMPGSAANAAEQEMPRTADGYHRITNISRPTLTLFLVAGKDAPAPVIVVCPGGGYHYVVFDKEGTEIASWLNSVGISALVLKYRVPHNRDGALQDVQRALSIVRANAANWHVDSRRLGIMGFSAGGDLGATASTRFDQRAYEAIDAADRQSCRPDFAVLVYPAYLEQDGKISPELNLRADIPPTVIVHTEDDTRFVNGSKLYHAALDSRKVPNELLLYPAGGHGYGLHSDKAVRVWPEDVLRWLEKIGMWQPRRGSRSTAE